MEGHRHLLPVAPTTFIRLPHKTNQDRTRSRIRCFPTLAYSSSSEAAHSRDDSVTMCRQNVASRLSHIND